MVVDGEYHGNLGVDDAVELLHKIVQADKPPEKTKKAGGGKKKGGGRKKK